MPKVRLHSRIMLAVMVVVLSACATTPTPVPTAGAPIPTTVPATALPIPTTPATAVSPIPTALPLAADVLLVYHKSGGIAGLDETLVVHQGGVVELTTRNGGTKSIQADEAMLQPLRRMLEQKDFGALAPLYQAVGADLFVYTITARDANGQAKTVTTMDSAQTPPFLGQLIAMLDQLRAQVK